MYLFVFCQTIQALVNLNPKLVNSSGSCEASSASLILAQEQSTMLNFTFTLVRPSLVFSATWSVQFSCTCVHPAISSCSQNTTSNRYHLSGLTLLANWSDMTGVYFVTTSTLPPPPPPQLWLVTDTSLSTAALSASNTSLNYLRSTLGRSYMCNTEQVLAVAPSFSLNTFKLQVQPFEVTNNQFATGTSFMHLSFLHLGPLTLMAFTLCSTRTIMEPNCCFTEATVDW